MLLHTISESDNGRMMIRYHIEFKSLWLFKHPRFSTAAKLCRAFKNVTTLAEPGGSGGPGPGRGGFPAPRQQPFPLLSPLSCRDGVGVPASPRRDRDRRRRKVLCKVTLAERRKAGGQAQPHACLSLPGSDCCGRSGEESDAGFK